MSNDGLASAHDALREAARACFADRYGNPTMYVDRPLGAQLQWVPALRFTVHRHINVFVEPSDNGPYPRRLVMLYVEAHNLPEPIAIYSVCHEAAMDTPAGRQQRKQLKALGFGLVTVDGQGHAEIDFPATPIVQLISDAEFRQQTKGLPKGIRQPVSEAFEHYRGTPVNGVKTLSEMVEALITKAGKDSASRNGISAKDSNGSLAVVLDALHQQYPQARAAIGGARKFNNECRNLVHHAPRTKKDAYRKYADCRHHFLEGLHTIQAFRKAMKAAGLTGSLPRT